MARRNSARLLVVLILLIAAFYALWARSIALSSFAPKWLQANPWTYTFPRDANEHGLTDSQCSTAFPDFYGDIQSAVASRHADPISLHELEVQDDVCLVRVLIFDGELFIVQGRVNEHCWITRWHERTSGFLHSIHQAIVSASAGTVPNVEFVLDLDDDPQRPINVMHGTNSNRTTVWGLTRLAEQRHVWLVPDYAYWAWPSALVASHTQMRRKMKDANTNFPWDRKRSQAIWRGVTHLNPQIREPLVHTAEGKSWGDVKICDIYAPETKKYCITQDQHCEYKFPIHTEGYTYSGRLKYLQLCNSAPVVHHLKWIEHHHGLMRPSGPNQNYIQVENDWSDLEGKVLHYLQHENEAITIARNSYETFYERYLTPAATSCYWRKLISAWASIQDFDPQLYVKDEETGRDVLRGVPFEAYALDAAHPMPDV